MQAIGIKDLQINPAKLTRALESHEYAMITKRSKPIGIAVSFDDEILTNGLQKALLIDAYKNAIISLGQLSTALAVSKEKTLKLLSLMGIDVIDYEFKDEVKNLDTFL